jgi:hypothetical protein
MTTEVILQDMLTSLESDYEELELLRRSNLQKQALVKEALGAIDPPIPEGKQPVIDDIIISQDAKLVTVVWQHDKAVDVFTSNGEDKSASGRDDESPLQIAVGSKLAEGFAVANGAFVGRIVVTLSDGGQSVTDERFIAGATPSIPEVPTNPESPDALPFPLQARGETPKLVRSPDDIQDITALLGGSHKVPNHPSRRAIDESGRFLIGGSWLTIVDLETEKVAFKFPNISAVTWSAKTPNTAWAIDKDGRALWRYHDGEFAEFLTARTLGFGSINVEAEGEFIDGKDKYAWLKADDSFLIRVSLDEKRIVNRWAVAGGHDMWPIDYSGRYGMLDTLPGSPKNPYDANWRFYDCQTNVVRETEDLHTAHATSIDGGLVDVYGVIYSPDNLKGDKRLQGLGHGVSTGQHVQYNHAANAVVWTQGGKTATTKQINLVSLDGQHFAYLSNAGRAGWSLSGVIYATSWLKGGVFKLAYCNDGEVVVKTWR